MTNTAEAGAGFPELEPESGELRDSTLFFFFFRFLILFFGNWGVIDFELVPEIRVVLLLHLELEDRAREDVEAALDDVECVLEPLDLPLVTFNAVSELDFISFLFD